MANRARVSVLVINLLTINIEAARKFDENIATIQDNAGGVYSISNKYENVDIFKFIGDKISFLSVRWRHRRKKLRHLNITTESLAMKSMCRHRPLQDIRCTIKNYLLYHYQDHLYHSPIHFTIYHYTLYHCALSVGVGSQLQGQPSSDCQAESEKGLILSRVLMISRISSYLLPDNRRTWSQHSRPSTRTPAVSSRGRSAQYRTSLSTGPSRRRPAHARGLLLQTINWSVRQSLKRNATCSMRSLSKVKIDQDSRNF